MRAGLLFVLLTLSFNSSAIIIGTNDLARVSSELASTNIRKLAKVVGHIKTSLIFPSKCSGFLISDSLFITTTDCIPAYLTAGRIKIYFNNLENKNEDKFSVDEIVMRDGPTKLVLLRLKKSPGKKQGFLKISDGLLAPGDRLGYIENDSQTSLLQFMTKPCEASGYSGDNYLVHDCDTTAIQGAPIFNEKFEMVGMQYGFYFTSPIRNNAISSHEIEPLVRPYL